MHLENFENQKVQIKLRNFPAEMTGDVTGIYKPDEWYLAKLVKSENSGIWVENPCYKQTLVRDEDGTAIPEENQIEETCVTHLLIRWEYISSIITFPEKQKTGVDKKAQLIGFRPEFN
ncbi:hypothetical protein AM500_16490 [Bacillus sp. FJAT-18017]|uniref:hypothetical protein n=1 Tax=Bacillus sp. FJAT-18017 TaxID=1705566 RepID=UPI0006AEEF8C|nr:hypothetical protein [Bacillus sp. FJAT-18017]ALC91218.1 hypothetical protein AM500_16490 [Bacillus sp. FJAT-18017]